MKVEIIAQEDLAFKDSFYNPWTTMRDFVKEIQKTGVEYLVYEGEAGTLVFHKSKEPEGKV